MKNIKWLFFDIGGVLVDESRLTQWKRNAIYRVAKKFLPGLTTGDITTLWSLASRKKGGIAKNIFLQLLKKPQQVEKAYAQYQKLQKEKGEILLPFRPGVKKVISQLAKKYQLGIIANQPKKI